MGGVVVNGNRETLISAIENGSLKPAYVQEAPNEIPLPMGGFFGIYCAVCGLGLIFEGPAEIPNEDIPCHCPSGLLLEYAYPGKPRRDVPPTRPLRPRGPQDETGRRIDGGMAGNPAKNPLSDEQREEISAAYKRAEGGRGFSGRPI